MEAIVNNLNGYLHSLGRLSGNKCAFWAECIEVESSFENTIDEYFAKLETDNKILEREKISYSEVKKLLKNIVFANLSVKDSSLIELFAWDIVEYYGLASTDRDPGGEFNPLVSNGTIKISVQSDFYKSCDYYVVQISNYAVITGLAVRA